MLFRLWAIRMVVASMAVVLSACHSEESIIIDYPNHFEPLDIPKDNPLSEAAVGLGEYLFFEKALSIDSTISCASCHKHEYALADNQPISPGVFGGIGKRNTPSLYNAAHAPVMNKDGGVRKLDLQALVPIEDEHEMGLSALQAVKRLNQSPLYVTMSKEAYGKEIDAYVMTRALASYVRTLVNADSPYDEFLKGDNDALSDKEKRGKNLFFSDRLQCASCHSGPLLTDHRFQNNGLYKDYKDLGRALITLKDDDVGKFRVPSLRNVAVTAPYMHDGSISTLSDVVDHYASGGSAHKNKSKHIYGFSLKPSEKEELIAFLHSLSGSSALHPLRDIVME